MKGLEYTRHRLQQAYLSCSEEFFKVAEETLRQSDKSLTAAVKAVEASHKYVSMIDDDVKGTKRKALLAIRRHNPQIAEDTLRYSVLVDMESRRVKSLLLLLQRRVGMLEKARASVATALKRTTRELDGWRKDGELKHLATLSGQMRALSEGSLRTLSHVARVDALTEIVRVSRERLEALRAEVAAPSGAFVWPARLKGGRLRVIDQIAKRELGRLARKGERSRSIV